MKNEVVEARPDYTNKFYFSQNERACSFANAVLAIEGHYIVECHLVSGEDTEVYIEDNRIVAKGGYRDLIFEAVDNEGNRFLIGFEFQTQRTYIMPFRTMRYDERKYQKQFEDIPRELKEKFRVEACLTFTVYMGPGEWRRPNRLSEMSSSPDWILESEYFNDYDANVLHIKDFRLDRCDHEETRELLRAFQVYYLSGEHAEQLEGIQLSQEAALVFANITGNVELLRKSIHLEEGEVIDMCEYTKQWQAHAEERGEARGIEIGKSRGIKIGEAKGIDIGRSEGIDIGRSEGIDIGRSEGIEIGKLEMIQKLMVKLNSTAKVAMDFLGISDDEQQIYLPKLI